MTVIRLTEKEFEAFLPYIPKEYVPTLSQPQTIVLGAVDDDTDVATGIVIASVWSNTAYIDWVYVGEGFRNNGVGILMVRSLATRLHGSVQEIRAEFSPDNWDLRNFFRYCIFDINYYRRPIYSIPLGKMRDHFIFKPRYNEQNAVSLSEVPQHLLNIFNAEMERISSPIDLPIRAVDYDSDLSFVCIHGMEITNCILIQTTDEEIHLSFVYSKTAYSRNMPMLICVAAQKALKRFPETTPITMATVSPQATAIVSKMFPDAEPIEICVASLVYR